MSLTWSSMIYKCLFATHVENNTVIWLLFNYEDTVMLGQIFKSKPKMSNSFWSEVVATRLPQLEKKWQPGSQTVAVFVLQCQWAVPRLSSAQVQWSSSRERHWSYSATLKLEITWLTSGCLMISWYISLSPTCCLITSYVFTGQWDITWTTDALPSY